MRSSKEFKLEPTKTGTPALPAGGGAYTNKYSAHTVLSADLTHKTALFIKTAGNLACMNDQAIIPIQQGDIIVILQGLKPASDQNPAANIDAWKITEITPTTAIGESIEITHNQIPYSVIEGSQIYHNRDGSYFCLSPVTGDKNV